MDLTTIEDELRGAHRALRTLPDEVQCYGKIREADNRVLNALDKYVVLWRNYKELLEKYNALRSKIEDVEEVDTVPDAIHRGLRPVDVRVKPSSHYRARALACTDGRFGEL